MLQLHTSSEREARQDLYFDENLKVSNPLQGCDAKNLSYNTPELETSMEPSEGLKWLYCAGTVISKSIHNLMMFHVDGHNECFIANWRSEQVYSNLACISTMQRGGGTQVVNINATSPDRTTKSGNGNELHENCQRRKWKGYCHYQFWIASDEYATFAAHWV